MRYGLVHASTGTILETCSEGYAHTQMKKRCEQLERTSNQLYYVGKMCQHCNNAVAQLKEHRGDKVYELCLHCSELDAYELESQPTSVGCCSNSPYQIILSNKEVLYGG